MAVIGTIFNISNINYQVISTTPLKVTVAGYASSPATQTGTLNIPSTVTNNGNVYTVTEIANSAFKNKNNIVNALIIPSTVTYIGTEAFRQMSYITTLTLNDGLITISDGAFYGITFLNSLIIPKTVITIGSNAFNELNSVKNITFKHENTLPSMTIGLFNRTNSIINDSYTGNSNYSSMSFTVASNSMKDVLRGLIDSASPITLYVAPPPIVCFLKNSKILTNKGYIPIEDLKVGDLVKTFKHDYVPICMLGKRVIIHLNSVERIKDQLYKCSKSEYPELFEDLIITGCHSILIDRFKGTQRQETIDLFGQVYLTDGKARLAACLDERASVYESPGTYTIYHLALENDDYYMNYGIYANGLLVETCSKRYLKELSNMILY